MHYEVEVQGRLRRVAVHRIGDGFSVAVDGRVWRVDAARIDAQTLSLIVGRPGAAADGPPLDAQPSAPASAGGPIVEVVVTPEVRGQIAVHVGAVALTVTLNGGRRRRAVDDASGGPQRIVAPMPGKVVRVLVSPGDAVRARQGLIVVEAMKMENELRAARDGIVGAVHVKEGVSVDAGTPLIEIR